MNDKYITKILEEFEEEFVDEKTIHLGGSRLVDIKDFLATSIQEAVAEERERVVEIVDEKVKEYHKDCLTDMFINGKFWAYKEMQDLLSLQDKPVTSNK